MGEISWSCCGHEGWSHELTRGSHDHILPPQGSSTSILELNDLQIGDYVFTLTVTDGHNQQSSVEVSVAVVKGNPVLFLIPFILLPSTEANKPPTANAGPDKVMYLMIIEWLLLQNIVCPLCSAVVRGYCVEGYFYG